MVRRAQAWSMDLIIGVLVFMLAVGIIYSLLVGRSGEDAAPLRIESEVIATKLVEDPQYGVAAGNQLDAQRLGELTSLDYETLKAQFGVRGEFCIFLRDEMGNLTFIQNGSNVTFTGVGSGNGELNITCLRCGAGGSPTFYPCGAQVPDGCTRC